MITTFKNLKKYLKSGGKLKMVYHINPKTILLGSIRRVTKLTNKEWVFEAVRGIPASFASPLEEEIVFGDTKFSIKIKDKIIVTYEYAY